jgi:hypothetical protein
MNQNNLAKSAVDFKYNLAEKSKSLRKQFENELSFI